MKFIAHNILFDNGTSTMDSKRVLLGESKVWAAIKKSVELCIPKEDWPQMKVVDLGCLEGGYAHEFARLGFEALGIEAREENIKKCNYVKEQSRLPKLNFVKDDVRNLANYGHFDIIFCSGLLYHLHDPVNFLEMTANYTGKMLILNTHIAPENDYRYNFQFINKNLIIPFERRRKSREQRKNYQLSRITKNEGYRGRWYPEWEPKAEKGFIESRLKASYNNYRSFWLCKKDLVQVLHNVGFTHVFEQYDFTGDMFPKDVQELFSRGMFIAVK